MIAGSLNVCFGSVAAGGPQRFWAAALRSKPAAQITRLASLPQAEIGQERTLSPYSNRPVLWDQITPSGLANWEIPP